MEKNSKTHIVKGCIIALIIIVFSIVVQLTGQMMNRTLGFIPYLILIGGLIYAGISFSKEKEANVTFGNVFAHCFRTNAVVTVLVIIWSVLSVKLIFPNTETQMIDAARVELQKNDQLTDEQFQQAMRMVKKSMIPLMIGGALLGYAILGAIGSLLAATFAKKNPEIQQPFK